MRNERPLTPEWEMVGVPQPPKALPPAPAACWPPAPPPAPAALPPAPPPAPAAPPPLRLQRDPTQPLEMQRDPTQPLEMWWIASDDSVQAIVLRMQQNGIKMEYPSLGMPLLPAFVL